MKGMEEFRQKLPDLNGKKMARIPLIAITSFILGILVLMLFDNLQNYLGMDSNLLTAFFPIIGVLIVEMIGFFLLTLFWRKKETYLKKNYEKGFQNGLKFVLTGFPLIVSVPIHSILLLPFYNILNGNSGNEITQKLNQSLLIYLGVHSDIDIIVRVILGFLCLVIGLIGYRKIVNTFGIDYMILEKMRRNI